MTREAQQLWQEKLELLLAEEAKAVDPAQIFKIRKDIAEAKAKLAELDEESGGQVLRRSPRIALGARNKPPPRPHYTDETTRELARSLEQAYRSRAILLADGEDTTDINETILDLRRKIREGGQLKEGDFLLDGRFQLLEMVGRGGFAQVWRAYDQSGHGTETRYWSGDSEEALAEVGWYRGNSDNRLHRVGKKRANPWGLYDGHGNVWEWTLSPWRSDYSAHESGRTVDPAAISAASPADLAGDAAATPGGGRVIRGGGYWSAAARARSAFRDDGSPGDRDQVLGFRLVRPVRRPEP